MPSASSVRPASPCFGEEPAWIAEHCGVADSGLTLIRCSNDWLLGQLSVLDAGLRRGDGGVPGFAGIGERCGDARGLRAEALPAGGVLVVAVGAAVVGVLHSVV